MIKLALAPLAKSKVEGKAYVHVTEPDRLGNSLDRLANYNEKRLSTLAPKETNRFTSMYFDPLFKKIKQYRSEVTASTINKEYVDKILKYIGDESIRYATLAEVAARVTTSVKEADAFMNTITATSPILKPFAVEQDADGSNLKLFAKLALKTFDAATAKRVIDNVIFPTAGAPIAQSGATMADAAAAFTAKSSRPLARLETIQMVDDIMAYYVLAKEIQDSGVAGSINGAFALHIILDAYISMLQPDSSAMAVLHQELAGQSSVVSLDVIRRITSSFATVGLTSYLAVPTLRMFHITDLARKTAQTVAEHVPAAENAYMATTQTLELLKDVNSMAVPYLKDLYEMSGTEDELFGTALFEEPLKIMPPVFKALIEVPQLEVLEAINGPLPIGATVPINLQSLGRSAFFSIAAALEEYMSEYRTHVMNYNVVVSQYFKHAETGLLPTSLPSADQIMGRPEVSIAYATPFTKPNSIRPVKYDADGVWKLDKYVNRPWNMFSIIQEVIADQPQRFVFSKNSGDIPDLGGTQGARFLSMPIPGCYASFTERYAMAANITSFLDLLGVQAKITTRDKFFTDLSYLLLFAKGTDDFVHLLRSIAPYFLIDIKVSKGEVTSKLDLSPQELEDQFNLDRLKNVLTAWGYPIAKLDAKQRSNDGSSNISKAFRTVQTVTDPSTGHSVSFTFRLRTFFPKPSTLLQMRVPRFTKMVLMQPISEDVCNVVGLRSQLADEEDLENSTRSFAEILQTEAAVNKVAKMKVEWLENFTYYHETAAAPHILLDTSLTFAEAFNYTPQDVRSMLTTSIIIADDAEGFTQVFQLQKIDPVMVVAEDEESDSFPSTNRGQEAAPAYAPAVKSEEVLTVDMHTDEGRGEDPDPHEVSKAPKANLMDTEARDLNGDAPADVLSGDLLDGLRPEPEEPSTPTELSEEEKEKKRLEKKKLKAVRKTAAQKYDPNTGLPNRSFKGEGPTDEAKDTNA